MNPLRLCGSQLLFCDGQLCENGSQLPVSTLSYPFFTPSYLFSIPSYVFSIPTWFFSIARCGFFSHFGRTGCRKWVSVGWFLSTRHMAAVTVLCNYLAGGVTALAMLLPAGLLSLKYGYSRFLLFAGGMFAANGLVWQQWH